MKNKIYISFLSLISFNAFAAKYTHTYSLPVLTRIEATKDIYIEAFTTKYESDDITSTSKCQIEYASSEFDRVIPAGTKFVIHNTHKSKYGAFYKTGNGLQMSCGGYPWGTFKELRDDFEGTFTFILPEID